MSKITNTTKHLLQDTRNTASSSSSALSNQTHSLSNLLHPFNLQNPNLLFNTSQWNAIIRTSSESSSQLHLSPVLYSRMIGLGVAPNKHTFPLVLKSVARLRNEETILQVFGHVIKFGFEADGFVRNSLVSGFANCGFVEFARKVFDERPNVDVVTWTAMINGYVRNGYGFEGLELFLKMRLMGVKVDEVTVVSVLSAAGSVGNVWFGRCVHGFYLETGRVKRDVYVGTTLVDMYAKCGYCDCAHKAFDELPMKNVVSWTSLIAGYVQCSGFVNALDVFRVMLAEEDVKPNQSTLMSVLTACAQLGALDHGRWLHRYIERNGLEVNSMLGTALIDMYTKCGCVDEALVVFDNLPVKDVYPWTAMINGLAASGDALRSLNLFSCMLRSGVRPNLVTFIGVLSACSHGGLVDEGWKFFKLMRSEYYLEPSVDHYGCMVDLLGRAGHLEEAVKLIEDMPMEPTPGVWGALLGACMIHKAYGLGRYIGERLIELQPNHSGRYSLLANMYAACKNWEAAATVRKIMKEKAGGKIPGLSWIEVNGVVHEFIAFDYSHSEFCKLYETLEKMMLHFEPADDLTEIIL